MSPKQNGIYQIHRTSLEMNQTGTSEQSFLLASLSQSRRDLQQARVQQILSTVNATSSSITSTLQNQLADEVGIRYLPYRPYIPPVIPSSVMELEMRTRNVGVPIPTMTIASCKGSQFVTR
jgi:hypothetical protein